MEGFVRVKFQLRCEPWLSFIIYGIIFIVFILGTLGIKLVVLIVLNNFMKMLLYSIDVFFYSNHSMIYIYIYWEHFLGHRGFKLRLCLHALSLPSIPEPRGGGGGGDGPPVNFQRAIVPPERAVNSFPKCRSVSIMIPDHMSVN